MLLLLADLVLVVHAGVALFVVASLPVIVVGNVLGWSFVNGVAYRLTHLGAILVIAVQSWLGTICPLTALESWLRVRSGGRAYSVSFIEHWVGNLLFYSAPTWVFTLAYSAFVLLVALAWWKWPPRSGPPATHLVGGPSPTQSAAGDYAERCDA